MIPTRNKIKLPKHLSYPIGAEAVSEALAATPLFELLSLVFWNTPTWRSAEARRILAERMPYAIVEASYKPRRKPGISASNDVIKDGWYDAMCEVWIYAVLPELRDLANRLLREQGLPAVAAWLKSSNQGGWLERHQRIELIFDPTSESLTTRATSGV